MPSGSEKVHVPSRRAEFVAPCELRLAGCWPKAGRPVFRDLGQHGPARAT